MKCSGSLREGRYVPFGPFLAGGGLAVLLIGRNGCWSGWAGPDSAGPLRRIGLTGGIGSGKSTVARCWSTAAPAWSTPTPSPTR
jgi:hypothetical protein